MKLKPTLRQRARQSLKILESLDFEAISRARSFVKSPVAQFTRQQPPLADEKIFAHLKKLELSTQEDVARLRAQVLKLEIEILASAQSKADHTPLL